MIGLGGDFLDTAAIQELGVALIDFDNNDIAAQLNASSRGYRVRQKLLLDDASASRTIIETDGAFTVDRARWVEWTTPARVAAMNLNHAMIATNDSNGSA